jgi:hypothetical protein
VLYFEQVQATHPEAGAEFTIDLQPCAVNRSYYASFPGKGQYMFLQSMQDFFLKQEFSTFEPPSPSG